MKAGIVQRIFLDHLDTYRKGRVLEPRQRRAANSIMTCHIPRHRVIALMNARTVIIGSF
jgi:hypothetical protein